MRPPSFAAVVATLVLPSLAFAYGGARDPSFGTDGLVTNATTGVVSIAAAVAFGTDGSIVVAGIAGPTLGAIIGSVDGGVVAVVRLTPGGVLDPTFGSGGVVTTSVGDRAGRGESVVVQPDGAIVVAVGSAASGIDRVSLVRYQLDGTLDPAFGSGGIVHTPLLGARVARLLRQPDGMLIVVGVSDGKFLVTRYAEDGSVDGAFGTAGVTTTAVGSATAAALDAELEPDGRIVAVGSAESGGGDDDFAVVKYDAGGVLDPGFGSGGIVMTPIGSFDDAAAGVARQPDGALVVCGRHAVSAGATANTDFALVRYDGLGNLDPTFGVAGKVLTNFPAVPTFPPDPFPSVSSQAVDVRVQGDGKLVAAGTRFVNPGNTSDVVMARYGADGTLDPTFGSGGKLIDHFDTLSLVVAVELQPDGRLVAGGLAAPAAGTNLRMAVTRHLPECGDGAPDVGEQCDGEACCASTCQFAVGSACDDGDACTTGDTCDGAGICGGGPTQCSVCEACDSVAGCVPAPRPACTLPAQPGAARLSLRDAASGDRLGWKWSKGGTTDVADFGSVLTTDDLTLCVFDTTPNVLVAALTPAGGMCGTKPCWKATRSGFGYRNAAGTPHGIVNERLSAGAAGKAKIVVSAKGGNLAVPALTALSLPLRVQLVSENGQCWEADFYAAGVKVNDGERFEGRSD